MLYTDKITAALANQRERLVVREDLFQQQLEQYQHMVQQLYSLFPTEAMLQQHLDSVASTMPVGARPMAIYDTQRSLNNTVPIQRFATAFAHHEEARNWAEQIITRTTTVAVDGSQIMPWRDASIPIALVQAGIYANPHDSQQPYLKDVIVEVLGPYDLGQTDEVEEEQKTPLGMEDIVNVRRFILETKTLCNWMREWDTHNDRPTPVAFMDGSLIVSFAATMHPRMRTEYIGAVTELLATSQQTKIPLVAYIDTSSARDFMSMLRCVALGKSKSPLTSTRRINDVLIWESLLNWGDCTVPFLSARGDVLKSYGDQQGSVAFTYLLSAQDRPPARIELPRWVAEGPEFARVIDIVRAELIIGNGYPYAIETADAVAVISVEDRARFYRLFQDFALDAGLNLTFSHKALSKNRRRI